MNKKQFRLLYGIDEKGIEYYELETTTDNGESWNYRATWYCNENEKIADTILWEINALNDSGYHFVYICSKNELKEWKK